MSFSDGEIGSLRGDSLEVSVQILLKRIEASAYNDETRADIVEREYGAQSSKETKLLKSLGLLLKGENQQKFPQHLPACVSIDDGSFVVVDEYAGKEVRVFCSNEPDGHLVPIVSLQSRLSPVTIAHQLEREDENLQAVELSTGKVHWFWGVFSQEWRTLVEVFLASSFANLLAISISMFALLVYDRVIPTQ